MALHADGEALIGRPSDTASMTDGLDETRPVWPRPDATMATPSILGPPGSILRSMPSLS